jgi:hypothetical protein
MCFGSGCRIERSAPCKRREFKKYNIRRASLLFFDRVFSLSSPPLVPLFLGFPIFFLTHNVNKKTHQNPVLFCFCLTSDRIASTRPPTNATNNAIGNNRVATNVPLPILNSGRTGSNFLESEACARSAADGVLAADANLEKKP